MYLVPGQVMSAQFDHSACTDSNSITHHILINYCTVRLNRAGTLGRCCHCIRDWCTRDDATEEDLTCILPFIHI